MSQGEWAQHPNPGVYEFPALASSRRIEDSTFMPCLVGCLALSMPRLTIILMVIFSDYIGAAYQTVVWPLMGFFCMP